MKKLATLFLVLTMTLVSLVAFAEDTGIQWINSPISEVEVVSLDDMKPGQTANITGFG